MTRATNPNRGTGASPVQLAAPAAELKTAAARRERMGEAHMPREQA
jgi:hypothetical protein